MKDWFVWKGVRCTSLGIRMLVPPDIIIPEERVNYTDAIGESGAFVSKEADHPVFSDIEYSPTCAIEDVTHFDEVAAYLRGTSSIEFANRPGGFYRATINNQIPFSKIVRGDPHRSFSVPFRCKPFWYPYYQPTYTRSFTSGTNNDYTFALNNPGNVYSRPTIKLFPDYYESSGEKILRGPCEININGRTITVTANPADTAITIDTEMKEAFDASVTPHVFMNSCIVCTDFPFLEPGVNTIHISGYLKGYEIMPRWRYL